MEKPTSYQEYFNALLPSILCDFFKSFITVLEERKLSIINKKRSQHKKFLKLINIDQINKTTSLLVSMILSITFPGIKIWLTHLMSSLCKKPKLMPYLHEILHSACIVSYTKRHENRLEASRVVDIDPRKKLIKGPNIWNLAVIDNIDFKASTFSKGNIYDVTHLNSHATLRMVFQFFLPTSLDNINEDHESVNDPIFGESLFTNDLIIKYINTLNTMLEKQCYHIYS